jgi:hypothetical protein
VFERPLDSVGKVGHVEYLNCGTGKKSRALWEEYGNRILRNEPVFVVYIDGNYRAAWGLAWVVKVFDSVGELLAYVQANASQTGGLAGLLPMRKFTAGRGADDIPMGAAKDAYRLAAAGCYGLVVHEIYRVSGAGFAEPVSGPEQGALDAACLTGMDVVPHLKAGGEQWMWEAIGCDTVAEVETLAAADSDKARTEFYDSAALYVGKCMRTKGKDA